MSTVPCPCCGQPIDAPVTLEALAHVKMAPSERAVLEVYRLRYPNVVSTAVVINDVWGLDPNGGPDSAANGISVRLNKINKKLRALGWEVRGVVNRRGGGGRALVRLDAKAVDNLLRSIGTGALRKTATTTNEAVP